MGIGVPGNPTETRTLNIAEAPEVLSIGLMLEQKSTEKMTHISRNFVYHIPIQNEALWAKYIYPHNILFSPPILGQPCPRKTRWGAIYHAAPRATKAAARWGAKSWICIPGIVG